MHTNQLTGNTQLVLTAKGKTHSPKGNTNMANHLSWGGVVAALTAAKGKPVTFSALVAAVQEANPTNQGNALGYVKYMVRGGQLAPVESK